MEFLETGNDSGDVVTHALVIVAKLTPANARARTDDRFSNLGDDTHFAAQVFARRRQVATRRCNNAHRIFNRYELLPRRLSIELAAAQRRQNQRRGAGNEMRPVQLRGNLHRQ